MRVEAGRAEERDVDPVRGGFDCACDDLAGRSIPAQGVDRDARGSPGGDGRPREGQGYGAGVRSGSISRPLYVWHVGQTRWGRLG